MISASCFDMLLAGGLFAMLSWPSVAHPPEPSLPPTPPQTLPTESFQCPDVMNLNLTNGTGIMGTTLRYPDVGTINAQSIDLLVEAAPGKQWFVKDEVVEPMKGPALGQVSFKSGLHSGVRMRFVNSGTDESLSVQGFAFTLYDIDSSEKGPEKFTIGNPSTYVLGAGSEDYYRVLSSTPDLTVESIKVGDGDDNPASATELDAAQIGRSLTVTFIDTPAFSIEADLTGIPGKGSRYLLFSLAQVNKGRSCPTPSPTPSLTECSDVQPPSSWRHPTCKDQLTNTKLCGLRRIGQLNDGICHRTCGVCQRGVLCYDIQPPSWWNNPTCRDQMAHTNNCAKRRNGQLNDGLCHKTCGLCVEADRQTAPPTSAPTPPPTQLI